MAVAELVHSYSCTFARLARSRPLQDLPTGPPACASRSDAAPSGREFLTVSTFGAKIQNITMASVQLTLAALGLSAAGQPMRVPMRVACIGDSITYGYRGWAPSSPNAYPVQLQNILGSDVVVHNLGVSGSTMSTSADAPCAAACI